MFLLPLACSDYDIPVGCLLDEYREDKQSECWFYHVLTFGTHILIVGRILLDEDREDKQSECWFYHVLTFGTHILIVGRILLDEYRTSNRSEFERAIASSYDSCQLSVDVGSVFRWHACICCRWCRWWAFLLLYCSERNTFGKNRSCRPRQSKCMEFWYDPWV